MRPLLRLLRNVAVALVAAFAALFRLLLRPQPVEFVVVELDGLVSRGDRDDLPGLAHRLPRGRHVRSVAELHRALDLLAAIPSLRGVVVRLGHVRCGIAVLRELRASFAGFARSGKALLFHAEALDLRGYWLASAGTVWLVPRGRLELVGFSAAATAAARPLARLGLKAHVVKAGAFKSAGELVGAGEVSEPAKAQLDELVGDLEALFVRDVASSRGMAEDTLRRAIDDGPFSAARAVDEGLCDGSCYADELPERLGSLGEGKSRRARIGPFAAAFAAHPAPVDWRPLVDRRRTVAVLDLEGAIVSGKSRTLPFVAATAGSDTLVEALTALRRDQRVKAVVLRLDSRGGSALASDVIWRAARKLGEEKPLVAFLEDVAASGGYYIAAAARRIVAAPTCITGSIGVFAVRPDASQALLEAGVDRALVLRGRHAAIYRPDAPLDDSGRAAIERDIAATYDDFLSVVAEGRALSKERVHELAQGRVYLAPRAKDLGLVDRLGTLDDAIDEARALAELPSPVRVVRHPSRQAGWRQIYRALKRDGMRLFLAEPARVLAEWRGERP